jgi:CCR4-NOT transcription complex subunit 7/8
VFTLSCSEDLYSTEAIDVLEKSGIDFVKHDAFGIAPNDFAELLITSGLVLSEDTTWISFHR